MESCKNLTDIFKSDKKISIGIYKKKKKYKKFI